MSSDRGSKFLNCIKRIWSIGLCSTSKDSATRSLPHSMIVSRKQEEFWLCRQVSKSLSIRILQPYSSFGEWDQAGGVVNFGLNLISNSLEKGDHKEEVDMV